MLARTSRCNWRGEPFPLSQDMGGYFAGSSVRWPPFFAPLRVDRRLAAPVAPLPALSAPPLAGGLASAALTALQQLPERERLERAAEEERALWKDFPLPLPPPPGPGPFRPAAEAALTGFHPGVVRSWQRLRTLLLGERARSPLFDSILRVWTGRERSFGEAIVRRELGLALLAQVSDVLAAAGEAVGSLSLAGSVTEGLMHTLSVASLRRCLEDKSFFREKCAEVLTAIVAGAPLVREPEPPNR